MYTRELKNIFINLSEIEPEVLRRYMLNEVGEKAKDKLYNYLKDLSESYPQFENWFYSVVIPEVERKKGEREIIIVFSQSAHKVVLTGIAILKRRAQEKKICTFRVHEDFRNLGIGTELFEKCFEFLGTRKPIITISQNRKDMFESHIRAYNFVETQMLEGYYTQNTIEYVYNGFLVDI
ncbi:acetyltransferase (GNAT) family protein [Paenibacillus cellulosilyticus]|uniref:Acetyltransferase (GNAT) family protein n=1 Tax=Paenibacillus cellulosilyticus TaxID=375489 RepID=A0A2V2YNW8_9BACL|nr:GNAT family N-acetyltransferase [Paenibacillus cellulosilyticus]PWV97375.1 acetyltransferase (GNAT) family protein [Paenibacillus cellulosilyticus]QKS48581.1 GNAT family N-acetyltransferase [Paenibacillus cellulosilyticus]